MQKRVFIIHGWGGYPNEGWFPWLKKELENRGFDVIIPQMPNSKEPRINQWIPFLKDTVKEADEYTYFVGHSIGCQAIARYLENLPKYKKIGGVVFVAGFFNSLSDFIEEDEIVHDIVDEWLKTPLNLNIVKTHFDKSVAIFSDNDPDVPIINQKDFKDILKSKIIIEHNKGHFSEDSGVIELPSALNSILEMEK